MLELVMLNRGPQDCQILVPYLLCICPSHSFFKINIPLLDVVAYAFNLNMQVAEVGVSR